VRRGLTETGMKVHIEKRRSGRSYCGRQLIAVVGDETTWRPIREMCIACRRRLQEQEQRA
jgi:hypothetical protein